MLWPQAKESISRGTRTRHPRVVRQAFEGILFLLEGEEARQAVLSLSGDSKDMSTCKMRRPSLYYPEESVSHFLKKTAGRLPNKVAVIDVH